MILLELKGYLVKILPHSYIKQSKQIRWLSGKAPDPVGIQEKIGKINVLIIGLDGLGLPLIEQLIGLGYKNYVLVDNDIVNENNFNRQTLFEFKDIGQPKVEVEKNYIKIQGVRVVDFIQVFKGSVFKDSRGQSR